MGDTKISDLTGVTAVADTTQFISVQPGSGKRVNGSVIKTFLTPTYDMVVQAHRALGSAIIMQTLNYPLPICTSNSILNDGTIDLMGMELEADATLTGMMLYMVTQGDYTADNNNKVGLYSHSAGVLTLRASCANDGDLWKAADNTLIIKPFTTPYVAPAGIYYAALIHNFSSSVTAPRTASCVAFNAAQNDMDYPTGRRFYCFRGSQADLGATITMNGGVGAKSAAFWFAIY